MRKSFVSGALCGAAVLALTLGGNNAARADLVFDQLLDLSGTGIGTVNTLLTLQNQGTETASVGRTILSPLVDVITGDAKTGASQTQTFTFAELGVGSASDLRVIVNLNEPDNAATLNSLVLSVFDASGNTVFSGGTVGALELAGAGSGTGNSGFSFLLDSTQAALLQSVFSQELRVGVSATLSNTSGGNETIFAGSAPAAQNAVPEPGTLALLGMGLLGTVGAVIRRRRTV